MFDREAFYLRFPIPLQNLACSAEGARIHAQRYGGNYTAIQKETECRTSWSRAKIREYRDQRLRIFIRHCFHTVPFYRNCFKKHGISTKDIQNLKDLQKLPILTKAKVQRYYSDLVSKSVPSKKQIITHTSGTTGGGLRFATTQEAIQEQWAIWWRYRKWHGISPGTWCGYFGGRSVVPLTQNRRPFWRYNYPARQILFSGYHLSPDNMEGYVAKLQKSHPPWLHGYPSLLALLASFMLDTNKELGYQLKWITTGAENLLPQQASLMEKAFGVKPIQHYGLAEAVANISECPENRLHVDEDFSAVEFIPNEDGPGYKIVGTNFTNPATPLIRYDTEDIAWLNEEKSCSCGRPGRIVSRIDGRKEDYVILRNGAKIGRMDHIFKDLINIREAQIYQKIPGEIILRVVKGKNFSQRDEKALLGEAKKRVGDDTRVDIDYVDAIERSKRGKLRFVLSDIPDGKL